MNEHRHIEEIQLTEDNGLIIYFSDESHTYMEPELLKDIFKEFQTNNKILLNYYREE